MSPEAVMYIEPGYTYLFIVKKLQRATKEDMKGKNYG